MLGSGLTTEMHCHLPHSYSSYFVGALSLAVAVGGRMMGESDVKKDRNYDVTSEIHTIGAILSTSQFPLSNGV